MCIMKSWLQKKKTYRLIFSFFYNNHIYKNKLQILIMHLSSIETWFTLISIWIVVMSLCLAGLHLNVRIICFFSWRSARQSNIWEFAKNLVYFGKCMPYFGLKNSYVYFYANTCLYYLSYGLVCFHLQKIIYSLKYSNLNR